MPKKSLVDQLPDDVRLELCQLIFSNNFSDYEGVSVWLAGRGHRIGKSSLHRYFYSVERREMEKRANAISAAFDGSRAEAGLALPLIVQIINPVTQHISIITSSASREAIEAAIAGVEP